jgi:hypothetical protein
MTITNERFKIQSKKNPMWYGLRLWIAQLLKKDVPRNSVITSAYVQEYVLKTKEPQKGGWNHLTLSELMDLMMGETTELLEAITIYQTTPNMKNAIHVFTEIADVQNYGMMMQDNMMENPHGERGK